MTQTETPLPKLGGKPASHDTRTVWLEQVMQPPLPTAPDAVDYTPAVDAAIAAAGLPDWGMLKNDTLGICAVAAADHIDMVWTANAGDFAQPTDADAVQVYEEVTGYNPNDPSTDQGTDPLELLKYWTNIGILVNGQRHLLGGFAAVAPKDHDRIKQGVDVFEGVLICFAMPIGVQGMDSWPTPPGPLTGDWAPASWGYHATGGVKYGVVVATNAAGIWVVSWGRLYFVEWGYVDAYCDQCFVLFSTDILIAGKSPLGFDQPGFMGFLSQIRQSQQGPEPMPQPDATACDLFIVRWTGLFTDPAGDCDGQQAVDDDIAKQYLISNQDATVDTISVGWDQVPPSPYTNSPDGLARWVKDQILAKLALNPKMQVIMTGHSFGGGALVFFCTWLWNWFSGPAKDSPPFTIKAIFFDPRGNPVRFGANQSGAWYCPITVAPRQLVFVERNTPSLNGSPLFDQPGVTNVDVTDYTNPTLGHIDVIGETCLMKDSRVLSQVLAFTS